ncbi:MAG: hypothetical protein AB7S26_02070 [Sandaracinaceae bacterium]
MGTLRLSIDAHARMEARDAREREAFERRRAQERTATAVRELQRRLDAPVEGDPIAALEAVSMREHVSEVPPEAREDFERLAELDADVRFWASTVLDAARRAGLASLWESPVPGLERALRALVLPLRRLAVLGFDPDVVLTWVDRVRSVLHHEGRVLAAVEARGSTAVDADWLEDLDERRQNIATRISDVAAMSSIREAAQLRSLRGELTRSLERSHAAADAIRAWLHRTEGRRGSDGLSATQLLAELRDRLGYDVTEIDAAFGILRRDDLPAFHRALFGGAMRRALMEAGLPEPIHAVVSAGDLDATPVLDAIHARDWDAARRRLSGTGYYDRDDVAAEVARVVSDDALRTMAEDSAGRELLRALYRELTGSDSDTEEQELSARFIFALARVSDESEARTRARARYEAGELLQFPFQLPPLTNPFLGTPIWATLEGDRVRVELAVRVGGVRLYRDATRTLPDEVYTTGIVLDGDQMIAVHMYDEGDEVLIRPAYFLVDLSNRFHRATAENMLEVILTAATAGLGGGAASASWLARSWRYLMWVADFVSYLSIFLRDNRGDIIRAHGEDGRRFVETAEQVLVVTSVLQGVDGLAHLSTASRRLRTAAEGLTHSGGLRPDRARTFARMERRARAFEEQIGLLRRFDVPAADVAREMDALRDVSRGGFSRREQRLIERWLRRVDELEAAELARAEGAAADAAPRRVPATREPELDVPDAPHRPGRALEAEAGGDGAHRPRDPESPAGEGTRRAHGEEAAPTIPEPSMPSGFPSRFVADLTMESGHRIRIGIDGSVWVCSSPCEWIEIRFSRALSEPGMQARLREVQALAEVGARAGPGSAEVERASQAARQLVEDLLAREVAGAERIAGGLYARSRAEIRAAQAIPAAARNADQEAAARGYPHALLHHHWVNRADPQHHRLPNRTPDAYRYDPGSNEFRSGEPVRSWAVRSARLAAAHVTPHPFEALERMLRAARAEDSLAGALTRRWGNALEALSRLRPDAQDGLASRRARAARSDDRDRRSLGAPARDGGGIRRAEHLIRDRQVDAILAAGDPVAQTAMFRRLVRTIPSGDVKSEGALFEEYMRRRLRSDARGFQGLAPLPLDRGARSHGAESRSMADEFVDAGTPRRTGRPRGRTFVDYKLGESFDAVQAVEYLRALANGEVESVLYVFMGRAEDAVQAAEDARAAARAARGQLETLDLDPTLARHRGRVFFAFVGAAGDLEFL